MLDSHVEAATTVDEDRVLRAFATCFGALVRTSWFQVSESGGHKAHQAFMFDSAQLSLCGSVVPYREIFVDCDDMEGLHVRSGAIARGGLRFSDRPEDYRTEVLGLMKTQTVKNSPIVPTGAKGVFIRKNPEITVAQAYSVFINGLLDVTDNIADGKTVHPAHTVTYGADSNYLVVAADKGTAAFSDIANHIAAQRGFWLGDAFAAGGTTGYDHKQMGITARGAWVSVRDHLTEIGIDVDTEAVTVAGIGDCSGMYSATACCTRPICGWWPPSTTGTFSSTRIPILPPVTPNAGDCTRNRAAAGPTTTRTSFLMVAVSGPALPKTLCCPSLHRNCCPSIGRPSPPISSYRPCCARRSTCSGTGVSART